MAQASGPIAAPKDLPSRRPGPRARATYACGSLVYFMVRPPLRASRIKNNPIGFTSGRGHTPHDARPPHRGSSPHLSRGRKSNLLIRDHRVMLDADLAVLYGVPTKRLAEQVRRNSRRFPADFMFRLTAVEARILRSRIATSSFGRGWGGRRYAPYAFTEQGVAMLSSVLRSPRAVQVNIAIMRAFVRLRGLLASSEALARKLDALERKYDARFKVVFDAIRQLMSPPAAGRRTIGFRARACGDNVGRLRPKPNLRSQAHQGPLRGQAESLEIP